jgi:hypothetical protein
MPSTIDTVRLELQLPPSVISDESILYVESKIGMDINLICAEVLRMVVRKFRGKIRYKIGKYEETIDVNSLRKEIQNYMMRSTSTQLDDGFIYPSGLTLTDINTEYTDEEVIL